MPEAPDSGADRREPDACPGVLRAHRAADGALIRIRLPGGQISPAQLETVASLAAGDDIELTSRGNLQLRSVADADGAAAALTAAGLLPTPTHERVRNIVASAPGSAGHRARVLELDGAVRAAADLAALPGRFLFGLDDGRGDIAAMVPDAELRAGILHLDGHPTDLAGGAGLLIAAARAFLALRTDQWRIRDVPDGPHRIAVRLGGGAGAARVLPAAAPAPVGWIDSGDGRVTLGAGVALGRLPARTALFLAAVGHPITVSPWRAVYLHELAEQAAETVVRVLAPMGLIFDADSPWLQVSACVGVRGCARARGDSLALAARLAQDGAGERTHVVACGRGCGAPAGPHRLRVAGTPASEGSPPAP